MAAIAHWFSISAAWVSLPLLAGISIAFHLKNRKKPTLYLAVGLVLIASGQLLQLLAPYRSISMDEFENIMSASGPPLSWYLGSIVSSIGLLVTVIGFAWVVFRLRCVE